MIQLRAYVRAEQVDHLSDRLTAIRGVRHLLRGGATATGSILVTCALDADVADLVLDVLRDGDLGPDDVELLRLDDVRPIGWRRRRSPAGQGVLWTGVASRARVHAHPGAAYLAYMVAAGVIAGVGVLTGSSILVVGAMAVSPDLLPLSAASVGLVERRWPLVARAEATLALGLGSASLSAAAATLVLRLDGRIAANLELADTVLGPSLTSIGPGTVLVGLAAGMAGMLAYETAGSAAVGVAISVTTIPAAAYLGAASVLNGAQDGRGSLAVLVVNVVSIEVAGAAALWCQRRWRARAEG